MLSQKPLLVGDGLMKRRSFLAAAGCALASPLLRGLSASPRGMHKAILISMLPEDLPYVERFRLAVEAGFQSMEVRTVDDDHEAARIKEAADQAGLRIHSVMNMAHWRYPLSSPDPAEVNISLRGMEASMRQAKLYGADAVLLVPAVVRDDTTYEQAWDRSQKQIRTLVPLAQELGVTIAIEEVWNKFLLTARDFNRYVDEFDSPWVRAYFDVGNVVHHGVPEHWIRQLGKCIVKIHLKDYKRDVRQFVNLGEGDVNWPEVRKALGEIGFEGAATVELPGGDRAYLQDVAGRTDRLLGLSG